MQGFIVAGTNSGCGKTTITIGLMALLKSLGKNIAPFKTGPDYIDPLFHSHVLGTPSYNLDSFMLSESAIKFLFNKHNQFKDITIIEGVMGMYDGMGNDSIGSTYELSKILNLPIILVVNCKGMYQSVAAIVKGFKDYKPNSNIKGIILNQASGKEYYSFLKELIEAETGIPCIGYLPPNKEFGLESRHLGLIQAEEVDHLSEKIELLRNTLSECIDIPKLLEISNFNPALQNDFSLPDMDLSSLNIGIAYDKAFRFYYKDNLELLEKLGATLLYFSPLIDDALPEECNCLYIGGGYPEVFAKQLEENKSLRKQIKEKAIEGLPIYAECGGLMYLTQKVIDLKGNESQMCEIFNTSVKMTERLKRFGYAEASFKGATTKCHEFHRSELIPLNVESNYNYAYHLTKPLKNKEWKCGLTQKNCLGAYAHIHFYSDFKFFSKIADLWKKAII